RRRRGRRAARGPAHAGQGPQGDHCRRRVPARPPAPHPARDGAQGGGRRARCAHALLGRSRGVHGRSFLHPPLRLPVADRQAQRGPAAHRSGRACRQRLRRLRPVRGGGARRPAVPVVRPHRRHPESRAVGPAQAARLARADTPPGWPARPGTGARRGGVTLVSAPVPIKVLIAALGGEGGGVLASRLHAGAIAAGHFVQGTSIPGVAQRTGATTYYLEIVPGAGARHASEGRRPVLALNAAPGEVDLVVASELLEATRAVAAVYVTPDRTLLIASSARVFTIDEKAAAGDGRLDAERMIALAQRFSRHLVLADFAAVAAAAGGPLNAVLLGAVAASGALPI